MKTFKYKTSDNQEIFARHWFNEQKREVKAIIQIAHGMAEHSERYNEFAKELLKAGFAVYANDHRGHGQTAKSVNEQGFFAEKNGWHLVAEDMFLLTNIIKKENPNIPIFLLGHSMGSLLTRTYITKYQNSINGIILSGTSGEKGLLVKSGKFVSKLLTIIFGKKTPTLFLNNMSFGKFNNKFKPNRTNFDWLSTNKENVDKYIADPFCGEIFTAQFFNDLSSGIDFINQKQNISKIQKDLPILMISGEDDPVGNFSIGVKKVYEEYKALEIKDIELKIYKNFRHEILNETNRIQVYSDVIEWINKKINNIINI